MNLRSKGLPPLALGIVIWLMVVLVIFAPRIHPGLPPLNPLL